MNKKHYAIGDTFNFRGQWLQCIAQEKLKHCTECAGAYIPALCSRVLCSALSRSTGDNVHFILTTPPPEAANE